MQLWKQIILLIGVWVIPGSCEHSQCQLIHEPELWRIAIKDVVASAESPIDFDLKKDGHVYQVGVFVGNSMILLQQLLNPPMIWGFDSFEGLPPAQEEIVSAWHKGQYSADPREMLAPLLGEDRHGWVAGYYEESLSPSNDQQVKSLGMKPASYIDIDCDLYESTRDALDFFFRNGLIVKGTVIGYDDWWVLPCGEGNDDLESLSVGEGRAHLEMSIKYGVQFKCVGGACSWWNEIHDDQNRDKNTTDESIDGNMQQQQQHSSSCDEYIKSYSWGVMLEVTHIDSSQSSISMHGFDMTREEELSFTRENKLCQSIRHDGAVYTIRSNDIDERAVYESIVNSRSGILLKIDIPKNGDPIMYKRGNPAIQAANQLHVESTMEWSAVSPISLSMDVSEDGFESLKIRRNPAEFRLCYCAVVSPTQICHESNQQQSHEHNITSLETFFNHIQNVGSRIDLYWPKCYPILRGGGSLKDVNIPPLPRNNTATTNSYHVTVASWVMPRLSASMPTSSSSSSYSSHFTVSVPTDIMAFQCVQLTTSPHSSIPSSSEIEQEKKETIARFKNPLSDEVDTLIEYDPSVTCVHFGSQNQMIEEHSQDTSKQVATLVFHPSQNHSSSSSNFESSTSAMITKEDQATRPIITFNTPRCGDQWQPVVGISLDVDVDNDKVGSNLVKANPHSFELCYGEVTAPSSSSLRKVLSSTCQSLLSTGSVLPGLQLSVPRSESVVAVEAWLQGKRTSDSKENVVVGRTSVLLQ